MSDLLAIFGPAESDESVLDGIAAYHPDRVTVLVQDAESSLMAYDSAAADEMRDRLARLLAAIERRTGATVVGLAGDRSQLIGWRFDRELAPRLPIAA
jgi:hypothetical protein